MTIVMMEIYNDETGECVDTITVDIVTTDSYTHDQIIDVAFRVITQYDYIDRVKRQLFFVMDIPNRYVLRKRPKVFERDLSLWNVTVVATITMLGNTKCCSSIRL